MKHLFNLLFLLVLVGFGIGIAYMTRTSVEKTTAWPVLYIPLIGLKIMFAFKIHKDYE